MAVRTEEHHEDDPIAQAMIDAGLETGGGRATANNMKRAIPMISRKGHRPSPVLTRVPPTVSPCEQPSPTLPVQTACLGMQPRLLSPLDFSSTSELVAALKRSSKMKPDALPPKKRYKGDETTKTKTTIIYKEPPVVNNNVASLYRQINWQMRRESDFCPLLWGVSLEKELLKTLEKWSVMTSLKPDGKVLTLEKELASITGIVVGRDLEL